MAENLYDTEKSVYLASLVREAPEKFPEKLLVRFQKIKKNLGILSDSQKEHLLNFDPLKDLYEESQILVRFLEGSSRKFTQEILEDSLKKLQKDCQMGMIT